MRHFYLVFQHPLNGLPSYQFSGDIQLHDDCNTIVLTTSSNHNSRGRKLPLKLLKMKPQSQHQVSFLSSIIHFIEKSVYQPHCLLSIRMNPKRFYFWHDFSDDIDSCGKGSSQNSEDDWWLRRWNKHFAPWQHGKKSFQCSGLGHWKPSNICCSFSRHEAQYLFR